MRMLFKALWILALVALVLGVASIMPGNGSP